MPLRRRPRLAAAAIASVALVLGACTTLTSGQGAHLGVPVAGEPVPQILHFRDCTQQLADEGAVLPGRFSVGCGMLQVPLDYAHPDTATIGLAVVRIHDNDDADPAGSLLMNPGGPGGPGVGFAVQIAGQIPQAVTSRYDLIGFDPRGVGESAPVHCISNAEKDRELAQYVDVTTPKGYAEAERQASAFAAACARSIGSALPYFNTLNTARDMDQIRQAIGENRMDYLGFSYGTKLGWVYAHRFPDRVRAFVLDGAVDPNSSGAQQDEQQIKGFEDAYDQFAHYCVRTVPCNSLGDPRAAAGRITAATLTTPLTTGSGRPLTYELAFTGILGALYSEQMWPRLAAALVAAGRGDGSGLLALADNYNERGPNGQYTNILDANVVINCNDERSEQSDAVIHREIAQVVARFPLFGRWSAGELLACHGWQRDRTPAPPPAARTPTTVLVVGNLHDPATPYRGALDLTADLGHATLLTWNGQGHTSYLQGSTCIDRRVDAYLLTLKPPPPRTVCPS